MTLPGYGADVESEPRRRRASSCRRPATAPTSTSTIKLSTRNLAVYRDPGAILLDQLKEIWIDGELELVETANWVPKLIRKDFTLGAQRARHRGRRPRRRISTRTMSAPRSATTRLQRPRIRQAGRPAIAEADPEKRKKLVQDARLQAAAGARRGRSSTTCAPRPAGSPQLKGVTLMVNSQYNGWRLEDVWLDRQQGETR